MKEVDVVVEVDINVENGNEVVLMEDKVGVVCKAGRLAGLRETTTTVIIATITRTETPTRLSFFFLVIQPVLTGLKLTMVHFQALHI